MRYLAVLGLLFTACPAPLRVQQTLADRVHRATVQCVAAPAGPQKAKKCTDAHLCQVAAKDAAQALQDVQKVTASGDTDVAAEAKAAGLSVLADAACKHGGW